MVWGVKKERLTLFFDMSKIEGLSAMEAEIFKVLVSRGHHTIMCSGPKPQIRSLALDNQSSSWICQRTLDEEFHGCFSLPSHLAKNISTPHPPSQKLKLSLGQVEKAFTTLPPAVGSPRHWPETAAIWGCHRQYGHCWVFMHEDYVKVFIKKKSIYIYK